MDWIFAENTYFYRGGKGPTKGWKVSDTRMENVQHFLSELEDGIFFTEIWPKTVSYG